MEGKKLDFQCLLHNMRVGNTPVNTHIHTPNEWKCVETSPFCYLSSNIAACITTMAASQTHLQFFERLHSFFSVGEEKLNYVCCVKNRSKA